MKKVTYCYLVYKDGWPAAVFDKTKDMANFFHKDKNTMDSSLSKHLKGEVKYIKDNLTKQKYKIYKIDL